MGFAIAGLTCFVDTLVVNESVVLRMNGSASSPRHRKPPDRYMQALTPVRFLLTAEASPDF